eukprot:556277_1
MASVSTPKRSIDARKSPINSPSSNSCISSSSKSSYGSYYDFNIELDHTLSTSLYIEFIEWSPNMDVIALIMHQISNNNQFLWLQRCVGKWENLFNIDLTQQEFNNDSNIKVNSLTWRYDGNGVDLGLNNGNIIPLLIENNNTIELKQMHNNCIKNIKWIMHKKTNLQNKNKNENETNDLKYNNENDSENNINDINNIMQNNEALLSCTQLNPLDYPNQNNNN